MTTVPTPTHHNGHVEDDRPLGELVSDLVGHASDLVRGEIDLARAEVSEKAVQLTRYAAYGAGAAVVGLCALVILGHVLAMGMVAGFGMAPWLGYLLAFVVYALVAGLLGGVAYLRFRSADIAPTETIEHVQEDFQWLKDHT